MGAAAAAAAVPETLLFHRPNFVSYRSPSFRLISNPWKPPPKFLPKRVRCGALSTPPCNSQDSVFNSFRKAPLYSRTSKPSFCRKYEIGDVGIVDLARKWLSILAVAIGVFVILGCRRALALEGVHEYGIWCLGAEFVGVEKLMAKDFSGSDAYQRAGFGSCGAFRALRFFLHGRDFHYHSLALEGSDEMLLGLHCYTYYRSTSWTELRTLLVLFKTKRSTVHEPLLMI